MGASDRRQHGAMTMGASARRQHDGSLVVCDNGGEWGDDDGEDQGVEDGCDQVYSMVGAGGHLKEEAGKIKAEAADE